MDTDVDHRALMPQVRYTLIMPINRSWLYRGAYGVWSDSAFREDQLLEEEDLTPTTHAEWYALQMKTSIRVKMAAQGII